MQAGVPSGLLEDDGRPSKPGSAGHRGNNKMHIFAEWKRVTRDQGLDPGAAAPDGVVLSSPALTKAAWGRKRVRSPRPQQQPADTLPGWLPRERHMTSPPNTSLNLSTTFETEPEASACPAAATSWWLRSR